MQKNVEKFGISDKRGRVRTSLDPFVSDEGFPEPSLCKDCQSYYHHKRWMNDPDTYRQLQSDPDVHWLTCPACKKIAEGYAEGILTLRGSYLWTHEEEIRHLLKNEEIKASGRNPQERIIRMAQQDEELAVETTEQRLAEHLGRVLHRAHQGELKINWGAGPEICRVNWERML
jgi:NMD protein affecting ribosome stability and mRNA decay